VLRPNKQSAKLATLKRRIKRNLKRMTGNPQIARKTTATGMMRPRIVRGPALSQAGVAFLKCAFAPPDFTSTYVQGIPDAFRGSSLLKKHRMTSTINMDPGIDVYFLIAPVPGVAYYTTTTVANVPLAANATFVPTYFSDFNSLFGVKNDQAADIVSKFRFVSNHFELISVTNDMKWTGSISAWKVPLQFIERMGGQLLGTSIVDVYSITGLQSANATNANRFDGPSKGGIYMGAYNENCDFPFVNTIEMSSTLYTLTQIPATLQAPDFGIFQIPNGYSFPGFDNSSQSMLIKVSGLTDKMSFIWKRWCCVEYIVQPGSGLYEYQTVSPPMDQKALSLYRELIQSLPIAVPAAQNSDFWQRVLRMIRNISGMGAFIPGPVGGISRGVNMVASGIGALTM